MMKVSRISTAYPSSSRVAFTVSLMTWFVVNNVDSGVFIQTFSPPASTLSFKGNVSAPDNPPMPKNHGIFI